MNDNDIIRAVAEFGGWEHGHWVEYAATSGDPTRPVLIGRQWSHDKATGPGREVRNSMPDFLTSLDAIVPVTEKLNRDQQEMFENALWELLPCDENHGPMTDGGDDIITPRMFTLANADARQRCIALVKTIGRWQEDAP